MRRIVGRVALLNLAYFGVEFSVALSIGSVSLFADSIDFLEDTSINFLILIALGWSARHRSHMGMALAGILLIPGLATIWTAWDKFLLPVPAPIIGVPVSVARVSPRQSEMLRSLARMNLVSTQRAGLGLQALWRASALNLGAMRLQM